MAEPVQFPNTERMASVTDLSIVSMYSTALEVCYSVYGEPPVSFDAIQRFYEADASKCLEIVCSSCLTVFSVRWVVY